MNDLTQALKYASNLYQRGLLAIAAALYGIFLLISPEVVSRADLMLKSAAGLISGCQVVLLPPHQKFALAGVFLLNSFCIFWRMFDPKPRIWWGRATNFFSACLWLTVTGATLFTYGSPLPDAVGEIMLSLTALYTLTRTDFTARDRGSA